MKGFAAVLRFKAAALLLAAALGARAETPPVPPTGDSLIGIWSNQTTFGSPLQGKLTVERQGAAWRAKIAASDTRFTAAPGTIEFAFPGNAGGYRGMFVRGDIEILGHWWRPAVTSDPRYPGGSSQAFATALVLQPDGRNAWHATVRPLPDPFTLYLRIFRDADGKLLAAFRNPEQNSRGGASQFRVTSEGNRVVFSAQPDPAMPEIRLEATRKPSPDRLELRWEDLDRTIALERRTPQEAAGFFPRPPGSPPYAYTPPPALDDGWMTARAGETGIDETALTRMVQGLIDADPAARRPSLIHSLLMARHGQLVLEEYFLGYDRNTPHDLRSAGKTFASVLLGVVMKSGGQIGPNTKIYELMADRGPFANPDSRKARITLAHLMTHTAGLACNDNDDASPGNENTMQTQTAQSDWWKYTLDLPMAHEPGARYAYCSANINLVGGALVEATGGTWLPMLFERHIARGLQFGEYHWNLTPTGDGYFGGGAHLLPRDLLKIGQMYLDGGVWRGNRIVDAAWVAQSIAPHVAINSGTTGLTPDDFPNYYIEAEDGYAWHLSGVRSGERSYPAFAATGNGGQILIVVPEFELVAVFTGGNYMQGGIWLRWADEFIGGHIIPAIRTGES
ncbi:MAG: serine hydrolase domain-containing protein [Woeseiaceae bacterium]